MNLRGDVIPVCSLRQKFSMPEVQNTNSTKFLVTRVNGMDVALVVDEVMGIYDIDKSQTYEPPRIVQTDETTYLSTIVDSESHLVLVLSPNYLLTREEQESVEQMVKDR
jgi:purine-binding chemotaxis protein CheW